MKDYIKTIKSFIKEAEQEDFYAGELSVLQQFEDFKEEMISKHEDTQGTKWRMYTEQINGHAWEHYIVWLEEDSKNMKEYILEDEGY